jgi:WD40 repeat protein
MQIRHLLWQGNAFCLCVHSETKIRKHYAAFCIVQSYSKQLVVRNGVLVGHDMLIWSQVLATTITLWQWLVLRRRLERSNTTFFKASAFSPPIKSFNKICLPQVTCISSASRRNLLSFQPVDLKLPSPSRVLNEQNTTANDAVASSISNQYRFGVTSLHLLPLHSMAGYDSQLFPTIRNSSVYTFHVMVGTKYGDLISLPIEYIDNIWRVSQHCPVEWLEQHRKPLTRKKKLLYPKPIYCLITLVVQQNMMLLVGSADRYVHVWNKKHQNKLDSWKATQRLGLHTGWVKDIGNLPTLAQLTCNNDPKSRTFTNHTNPSSDSFRLLSIGCNRIESWIYTSSTSSSPSDMEWNHVGTTAVENAGNSAGCTLSSDLLCLEVCRVVLCTQFAIVIAVGGVDGRIHFYCNNSTTNQLETIATVPAHQGRVNVLSYDTRQQILISGSHDGSIRCWSLNYDNKSLNSSRGQNPTLSSKLVIDSVASYHYNVGVRITALMTFTPRNYIHCMLNVVAGTQNGSIHLLSLIFNPDCDRYDIVQREAIQIESSSANEIDSHGRNQVGPNYQRVLPFAC